MPNQRLTTYIQGKFKVFIDASNVHISVRDNLYITENDLPQALSKHDVKNLCWSVDYRKLNAYFQNIQGYNGINFIPHILQVRLLGISETYSLKHLLSML